MTSTRHDDPRPMVLPFPNPGPRVRLAYRELERAAKGTEEQRTALPPAKDLPRPWSPGTCKAPELRVQLWDWLDAVVIWLNSEFVFDPVNIIPACWPRHPHLVHELAVLADLRHRAELAFASTPLEEWHRYTLPGFLERMRSRIAEHCNEKHPPSSPSNGRLTRHVEVDATGDRRRVFARDLESMSSAGHGNDDSAPILRLVDTTTGVLVE